MEALPEESAILQFWHLPKQNSLNKQIFRAINKTQGERGLFLIVGTIVDGSLIAGPTSTKNKTESRYPELHSSKRSNQWFFGSKFHFGVDHETGWVHTLKVPSGNMSDVVEAASLLRGEEQFVHGNRGPVRLEKLRGAVVSMPHKVVAAKLVDELSLEARLNGNLCSVYRSKLFSGEAITNSNSQGIIRTEDRRRRKCFRDGDADLYAHITG
ncbi:MULTISPECIES: transposase [Methylomonas]|uniref:transposase n=1 Tax=Methylomonas TaxID=416 RepID=UPI0007C9697C|nr:transposase [Methylomonas koyamae]